MELLRHGDAEGLEQLVAANPRAARFLLGRLWDSDSELRLQAAQALAGAAANHPDLGREILRRLLWDLNDESATNGRYALPAIGEIGRRSPGLVQDFIGPMVSHLWDDSLRSGILRALCRVAETAPETIEKVREILLTIHDTEDPEESAYLDRLLGVERGETDAS